MAGYKLCPCGEWVRDEVACRTENHCVPCYLRDIQPRLGKLELVGEGMRVLIPRSERPKQRKRKRRESEQRTHRRGLARAARQSAHQRLALMVPDLYDLVLADERSKRGLDPFPVQIAIRGRDPQADLAYAERLASITDRGAS